jgi:hypothetical protein
VPPRNYRQNLELFVADARRAEILPILVTRPFVGASDDPRSLLYYLPLYNQLVRDVAAENGVPLLDAFALLANDRECFVDPIHNDRIGYRRLAEAALSQLKALGFVQTDTGRNLASVLDLATADDRRLEVGPGFWSPEAWPQSAGGRWTKAEATVELKRRHDDQALLVDLSCFRPSGHTSGFLEVNGRERAELPGGNGRHRLWVRLSPAAEERVSVRFVVQSAYRPRDLDGGSDDSRVLGVFLHEVRLERRPPDEHWQRDGTLHPEQAR